MPEIVPTLLVAVIGGTIFVKLRAPAGAIIGSLLAVAGVSLAFGLAPIPAEYKLFTQIIAGAFIGTSFDQKSVQLLRGLVKPALILLTCFVTFNVIIGTVLHRISSLDLCTALFATVPGGLTEMTILADDMGADIAVVSVFQISRLLFAICLFPLVISRALHATRDGHADGSRKKKQRLWNVRTKQDALHFAYTCIIATAFGLLGHVSGIPGGALLFSVSTVSVYHVKTGHAIMPLLLRRLTQMMAGALIGAKVTVDVVVSITKMWPYVLMVGACYMAFSLFLGWLLSHVADLDPVTATFASTAAGASDMALIAADFGTVTPAIAALQLFRMIGVIAVCPTFISIILQIF